MMICLTDQIKNAVNLAEKTKEDLQTRIRGLSSEQSATNERVGKSETDIESLEDYSSELLYQICLLQLGIDDE